MTNNMYVLLCHADEQESVGHIENLMNLATRAMVKDKVIYRQLLNAAVHYGKCVHEMYRQAEKFQEADRILGVARSRVMELEAELKEIKTKLKNAEQEF